MEVSNPRRILVVGAPDSGVLALLKALTGSAPEPLAAPDPSSSSTTTATPATLTPTTTAGLSHEWRIATRYYAATVPVWIDEAPDAAAWRAEFLSPAAQEVVRALGAWVVVFRKPLREPERRRVGELLAAVRDVVERWAGGEGWDGVLVAVGMGQSIKAEDGVVVSEEEWEEECLEYGFEYVDAEAEGKNEFGEAVGVGRLREALEANDWAGGDSGGGGLGLLGDDAGEADEGEDAFNGSFEAEELEMNMELMGMKTAIHGADGSGRDGADEGDDQELQVEELERMMHKLQAVREMNADKPDEERRRLAAKAVNDIMKSF